MPPVTTAPPGYVHNRLRRLGLSDALAMQTAPGVKVQSLEVGKKDRKSVV